MTAIDVKRTTFRVDERGMSLAELLVATAVGLILAGLCGHALTTFYAAYGTASDGIDREQQAHLALALICAELDTIVAAPRSTGCPSPGIQVVSGRAEFSANPYDRETFLRDPAPQGTNQLALDTGATFEVGDTVLLLDIGTVWDPA
ncbi:MAG TPA: prepilin-type N-terminal cleavage/methylation domain-containing protein, partial [Nitrospiria bacterium]|nr:prepilin-type N-terminal cleavage/methylation domain-containing protein [Nitrospiria bacterium]